MKTAIFSLMILTIGFSFSAFSHQAANYPNDISQPSQPPYPANPPTHPTASTDNVSSTPSYGSDRVRSDGGLFLEPMLLGSQEDTTIKTSQMPLISDDTSGTSNGLGVGLRFGGHVNEVFLLGVDARYSKMEMSDSFYSKADSQVYNIAPVVGMQTPYFGVRLLAGYVVAGENNPDSGVQGLNLKFKEATGWRVGAGIFVAAVSVNLEYQDLTYNTTEVESVGSQVFERNSAVDANNRGYTLSLSFPVEL